MRSGISSLELEESPAVVVWNLPVACMKETEKKDEEGEEEEEEEEEGIAINKDMRSKKK